MLRKCNVKGKKGRKDCERQENEAGFTGRKRGMEGKGPPVQGYISSKVQTC